MRFWSLTGRLQILLGFLLILHYGLLMNGWWVPQSDSDVYITLARNLLEGKGYQFNGYPVVVVPPAWPLLLAGAIRVCASFWFLNLMPMAGMFLSAMLWFRILLRWLPPKQAFWITLISATLFDWYRLTNILYTDPLYLLLLSTAILLALQISEGRDFRWRFAAVIGLVCLTIATRWAAVLAAPLVAAALLAGQDRVRLNRHWLGALLVLTVAGITFCAGQQIVHGVLDRQHLERSELLARGIPLPEVTASVSYELLSFRRKALLEYVTRFCKGGNWISSLMWGPMELGASWPIGGLVTNLVGWFLMAFLVFHAWVVSPRERWLWGVVLAYCAALYARWPWPNVRYLLPIVPLLLLGVWKGMEEAAGRFQTLWLRRGLCWSGRLFLIAVFAGNLLIYAVEVPVFRSRDFYAAYRAGECVDLIGFAHFINAQDVKDGEIAVSYRYLNLNRPRMNSYTLRVLALLTGQRIRMAPASVLDTAVSDRIIPWAAAEGVRYLVFRPPTSPWRVWHFQMPWIQEFVTGYPPGPPNPFFEFYEIHAGQLHRVQFPRIHDWPRHVPLFRPGPGAPSAGQSSRSRS